MMEDFVRMLSESADATSESPGSGGSSDDSEGSMLFNVAIATIFAREFLEGAIIISQYRTVIHRNEDWGEETKTAALKTVTRSAVYATIFAALVVIAVAVPLGVLSKDLDDRVVEIIEGISKVVAAICVVQLSVKIPVWLGLYWKVSIFPCKNKNKHITGSEQEVDLGNTEKISFNELRFNVAWNIWREMAECGVFLIPFFLGSGAEAIPLSALAGIAIALVLGALIYMANHKLQNKLWLAFFMSGSTLMLATGLFVGGCHEFEEVWGETDVVWKIENERFSHKEFPFVILKPFGYSSKRTVLQITTFWVFLTVGLTYHFLKWNATRVAKQARAIELAKENEADHDEEAAEIVKNAGIDNEKTAERSSPEGSAGSEKEDAITDTA